MNGAQTGIATLQDVGGSQLRFGRGMFDGNLALQMGQALALVSGTSTNAIITFTVTGTPVSGVITYLWHGKQLTIPYNCTAAALDALVKPLLGAGNYAITGGAWPGTALNIEMRGIYAGLTPTLPVQLSTTLSTGTVAVTLSTTNVPAGKLVAWDPTKVSNPAAVLSVSAAGTGTFAAGTYSVAYTWVTASGETQASPATALALSGSNAIRVAAINAANTPDSATALNVYVNGLLAHQISVSTPGTGGNVVSTDIAFFSTAVVAVPPPLFNTAYTSATGRGTFAGFAFRTMSTDASGQVHPTTSGLPANPGQAGQGLYEYVIGGLVNQSSIAGVSDWAELIRQSGARVVSGAVASGTAVIAFPPLGVQ